LEIIEGDVTRGRKGKMACQENGIVNDREGGPSARSELRSRDRNARGTRKGGKTPPNLNSRKGSEYKILITRPRYSEKNSSTK